MIVAAVRWISFFALWVPSLAWAGVPVRLPADENPEAWRDAFALAGLQTGGSGGGGSVDVVVTGQGWQLVVRDAAGSTRTATIATPGTNAQREDAALLMASLLRPIGARPIVDAPSAVATAPLPAPLPIPPRPKPAPKPAVVPPPPPVVSPPVEPVPAAVASPPTVRVHPSARLNVGAEWRPGVDPTAAAGVAAGAIVRPGLFVGLVADVVGPARVTVVGRGTSVAGVSVGAGLAYASEGLLVVTTGLEGGARWGRFSQGADVLSTAVYPWAAVTVGTNHAIAPGWSVSPTLRLAGDLRSTDIKAPSGDHTTLASWSARLSFGAQWGDFR